MEPSASTVVGYVRDTGLVGLMVAVLVGGYLRWWVWGWQFQEMTRDRDEWRDRYDALIVDRRRALIPREAHGTGERRRDVRAT